MITRPTPLTLPEVMRRWLKTEAKRRGVSMAEVVRLIIQREMDKK